MRQVYIEDGHVVSAGLEVEGEPTMVFCPICELAVEAEDITENRVGETCCEGCRDAKDGPRGSRPKARECWTCPAPAMPDSRECIHCYVERKL